MDIDAIQRLKMAVATRDIDNLQSFQCTFRIAVEIVSASVFKQAKLWDLSALDLAKPSIASSRIIDCFSASIFCIQALTESHSLQ
jgi:hypothetical protein